MGYDYGKEERIDRRVLRELIRIDREQRMKEKDASLVKVREEVFDTKTLLTLYSMMNSGHLAYLNGVVASGKESRVYWGVGEDGSSLAVKIYLVATAEFRHRLQYIVGDPRFKKVKKGMRNIIMLWARKEFKNLSRAYSSHVSVPKPIHVEGNVLLMEFIGSDGVPAPTLNQCTVSRRHYEQVVDNMIRLYRDARLVHADLSEFNIFLHDDRIVIFDFGSAVDVRHPNAGEFLLRDARNVNRFFSRSGVEVHDINYLLGMIRDDGVQAGSEGAKG
ncbi:MAG: serine protein kinase RIO [Candidatus Nitrosocaldus sp.]|nr:serine protein kinase RIO [Candidatus Nitrosocaldus sp.]MDW8275856.1 serine protein kinase RIO [Candidatus Nitrosocaldus sp.]